MSGEQPTKCKYIYMNKEICFISRPGDGLSYCCFQSEPNPKPMPGMETEWKDNSSRGGKAALRRFEENAEALQGGKKNGRRRSRHQSRLAPVALLLSSPSQTLRLTPLTSALRAARAHDAVLRMYPDLPLRFIKIHGDILVSYACDWWTSETRHRLF